MVDTFQENISEVVNDGWPGKESDEVPLISSQPPNKIKKTNLVNQRLEEAFEILKRPYPTTTSQMTGQYMVNTLPINFEGTLNKPALLYSILLITYYLKLIWVKMMKILINSFSHINTSLIKTHHHHHRLFLITLSLLFHYLLLLIHQFLHFQQRARYHMIRLFLH